MALPNIFGKNWSEFINDWCLGTEPTKDQVTTELGLSSLFQFWPEYVQKKEANQTKGLSVISWAIHLGLILESCKSLKGFEKILQRIKSDQAAAVSELKFAEKLIRIGIEPTLEPTLNGNVPDAKINFDNKEIYFEVIAPETSDAIKEAELEIQKFATELVKLNPGKRIEVFFVQDITGEIKERIKQEIKQCEKTNVRMEIDDIAIIIIQDEPFDGIITPQIDKRDFNTVILRNAQTYILNPEQKSMVIVELPITDSRAKKMLYGESHHFSRDYINILVIDLSKVMGGTKKWMELINRCLQPEQNRRFSAVIFFSEGFWVGVNDIKQTWNYIINKNAYHKVPEELIRMIVS